MDLQHRPETPPFTTWGAGRTEDQIRLQRRLGRRAAVREFIAEANHPSTPRARRHRIAARLLDWHAPLLKAGEMTLLETIRAKTTPKATPPDDEADQRELERPTSPRLRGKQGDARD